MGWRILYHNSPRSAQAGNMVKYTPMDTVLYITDLHVGSHVNEFAGVVDRAAAHRWRVIEVELERTTRSLADIIRQWRPAGCIIEGSKTDSMDLASVFRRVPVVYMDPDPKNARRARHVVTDDQAATAHMAARELTLTKPASYAFFGWCVPTRWSIGRERHFADEIRRTGAPFASFGENWEIGETLDAQRRFAKFLKKLPKPVGIFAVNDYAAVQVAEACRQLDWTCPADFTMVSVDNEEMHCELCEPTLSSIEQDFRGGGRLAADLLAELIANPKLKATHLTFAPTRLVRRQSSRALVRNDPAVARAVERIRRDAATGISAADILAEMPVSRRLAEKRFLAATGKTILEEIQSVRLAKVLELLQTDVPIGHIASRCGMRSDSYLKRFFKSRMGMTLREWRSSH